MLRDKPLILAAFTFVVLWLSALLGSYLRQRSQGVDERVREDLGTVLAAALTLLGLIIGFSFSMAVTRYDQRKSYEEAEANAIGTEYVRAGLLPAADAAKVKELLKAYVDQRVLFYTTQAADRIEGINASTARLQNDLWSVVQSAAQAQPTAVVSLAAAGMNDVLNSQGYTQAACLVEPHPDRSVGLDGYDRDWLHPVAGLHFAGASARRQMVFHSAFAGFDLIRAHCGLRQSSWRRDTSAAAKPLEPVRFDADAVSVR